MLLFEAGCELAPRLPKRLPPRGALGPEAGGCRNELEGVEVEAGVMFREKGDLEVEVPKSDMFAEGCEYDRRPGLRRLEEDDRSKMRSMHTGVLLNTV